jgi:pepF/M3 family oligoendopeptidase
MPYAPTDTWSLDTLFPGGPEGEAFAHEAEALERWLQELTERADALPAEPDLDVFATLMQAFEDVSVRLEQLGTFAGCAAAADATGKAALRAETRANELWNRYARALVVPNARIARGSEGFFAGLQAREDLAHMRGMHEEKRRLARFRLPEAEDALSTELARDGVLAWGELYDVTSGALRIRFDRGNGPEELSPGQLSSSVSSDDRDLRLRAHGALVEGWRGIGDTCARVLTHLTGTRQVLNARRGLDTLEEPLATAKIERSTLDAMLEAARAAQPLMHRYLRAKARVMGLEKLEWADTIALVGKGSGKIGYGEAQDFIVEHFGGFAPGLANFAKRAFQERWIEVEDRPGKRGGGFCADVPVSRQSRIFMTWGGDTRSVSTLAHELGHAYHNEVLHAVAPSQRRVPMTLAETASTFAEAIVREASLASEQDPAKRLRLLDGSLSDALAFLCNIPARFELEQALYRLRSEGPLEAEALTEETKRIFGGWYGPTVARVDSMYWASKLHFYIPTLAFYNFPYTFGFLFANLVYAHFRPLGAAGLPAYAELLRLTGDAWAEPVAKAHLGAELGDVATWSRALEPIERDLAAFEAAVDASV